jgi:hypothetical protein
MPAGSEVISVTHGDGEGERYAEVIREKAVEASLAFRVHRPDGVKDWNDVLKVAEAGSGFFAHSLNKMISACLPFALGECLV